MPNMLIASPGDPLEMSACLDYLIENPQPSYLRINKAGEPNIHDSKPVLLPGEPQIIKKTNNSDKLILSTGALLELTNNIWNLNEEIQNSWSVGSLPLWGESYRKIIYDRLQDFSSIATVEEHLLAGGFGSFLLEIGLSCQTHYLDSAVCGEVGGQEYLKEKFGLSANKIGKMIR